MLASQIVEKYNLEPHVEGGYYKELFRTKDRVNINGKDRTFASSIMFLLTAGHSSNLHCLKSDETWHFYHGDPLNLVILYPDDGRVETVLLGSDLDKGQYFQYTVMAGCWFGSFVSPNSDYALVGCSVYPAFEWEDFQLATPTSIPFIKNPDDRALISKLIPSTISSE